MACCEPKIWWVRSDPCGMFSASLTVGLVLYAQVVIVRVLVLPWYGFCQHVLWYSAASLLAIASHTRAQFSDPGTVPKDLGYPGGLDRVPLIDKTPNIGDKVPVQCRPCKAIKPDAAHHCRSCNRCVIRMDHHCPWVNNCVAMKNQKYFLLFLFYTAICCIYSGVLLVARFISCTRNMRQCTLGGVNAALCVVNFVEALVFGLFTIIMLFDQFSAIFDDTNADLNPRQLPRSKYQAMKDVFGGPISWRWLLPIAASEELLSEFENELAEINLVTIKGRPAPPPSSFMAKVKALNSAELASTTTKATPDATPENSTSAQPSSADEPHPHTS